jgi:D-sedoheptulose 7-phosphate isomerase
LKNFINRYKQDLNNLINNIDNKVLQQVIEKLEETEKKGTIYVLGNGGSAATASHMVNDLGAGLSRREIKEFKIYSLSDNIASCTALANDIGYENIFYTQLKNKISPDDLIIAISCSGNSPNITKAVNYAKEQGVTVIGLTGFDGGELKKLSHINLHCDTPKGSYGLVEDIHIIINHMIYSYFIDKKHSNG